MTQTEDLAQFDPASFEHIPVLLNECLDGLNIDPAGTYLDGTAGGAGHSRQIALFNFFYSLNTRFIIEYHASFLIDEAKVSFYQRNLCLFLSF